MSRQGVERRSHSTDLYDLRRHCDEIPQVRNVSGRGGVVLHHPCLQQARYGVSAAEEAQSDMLASTCVWMSLWLPMRRQSSAHRAARTCMASVSWCPTRATIATTANAMSTASPTLIRSPCSYTSDTSTDVLDMPPADCDGVQGRRMMGWSTRGINQLHC